MKLYLCPGYKTSKNWSKPIKWCSFLFNMKIVYTARWRLFATPDTPWEYLLISLLDLLIELLSDELIGIF